MTEMRKLSESNEKAKELRELNEKLKEIRVTLNEVSKIAMELHSQIRMGKIPEITSEEFAKIDKKFDKVNETLRKLFFLYTELFPYVKAGNFPKLHEELKETGEKLTEVRKISTELHFILQELVSLQESLSLTLFLLKELKEIRKKFDEAQRLFNSYFFYLCERERDGNLRLGSRKR